MLKVRMAAGKASKMGLSLWWVLISKVINVGGLDYYITYFFDLAYYCFYFFVITLLIVLIYNLIYYDYIYYF